MSGDRSSRGTRSGLSKSVERTRSGDESGNTARRRGQIHARRHAFAPAQPTFAAHGIDTQTKAAPNSEFPD
jgi:hypothetical protein